MWTSKNRARYDRSELRYPSDLTDDEWRLVEPLIPPGKTGGGISTLKSSNAPIGSAGLWSYPNAGSSSAPSHGSIAADGSPRIGRTSTERRSRSCASHQSASCSENSAIRPELSGQTLSTARVIACSGAVEELTS